MIYLYLHFKSLKGLKYKPVYNFFLIFKIGTNFFQVAIHELGHSLGLSHSPVRSSVMFAYYTGSGPQTLDYDDILGMYELYSTYKLRKQNANIKYFNLMK